MENDPRRIQFQGILEAILGSPWVYFEPPSDIEMNYPCFVYELDTNSQVRHADNVGYTFTPRYQVTYISHDPDSSVIKQLAALPLSSFSRHFATSGLNHDVFSIYH